MSRRRAPHFKVGHPTMRHDLPERNGANGRRGNRYRRGDIALIAIGLVAVGLTLASVFMVSYTRDLVSVGSVDGAEISRSNVRGRATVLQFLAMRISDQLASNQVLSGGAA